MTVSEIGIKRLQSLLAYDEGLSARELYIVEKELRKVLGRYFAMNSKDIRFEFRRHDDGIAISIVGRATEVKKFNVV